MKRFFKVILDNGIIISIALGTAYLFTYYYQKGKLTYYGIPLIYTDFSFAMLLEMVTLIMWASALIFILVNAILESFPRINDYRVCNIISRTIYLAIIIAISIAFTNSITISAWVFVFIYLFTLIFDLLMPIIRIKGKASYRDKWKEYSLIVKTQNAEEEKQKNTGYFAKFRKNLISVAAYVFILIMLCNWFNVAGSTKAENTEEYYVADDYEGKIVVHQTTEYYILMPIKENKLEREYEIVPTSNIGHLSHKNTGRITLK